IMQLQGQALDPAADGGLVHIERARNLQKSLPVQKVSCEQKAVLRDEFANNVRNAFRKHPKVVENWGSQFRRWAIEAVNRRLTMCSPVMIPIPLHQRRPQPRKQGAAARIGGK